MSVGTRRAAETRLGSLLRVLIALYPSSPVVLVTDIEEADELRAALAIGLAGFIPSSMDPRLALAALGFIIEGGSFFPRHLLRGLTTGPGGQSPKLTLARSSLIELDTSGRLAGTPERPRPEGEDEDRSRANDLTQRQREVLCCLREGRSNKEIARALDLSEATVKVHVRQVMKKLGVLNRTQAAVFVSSLQTSVTTTTMVNEASEVLALRDDPGETFDTAPAAARMVRA